MAASLRFYFDYISPYSYLAWQRAPAFAAAHGLELEPTPILLAALLNHHGHKGPGEIPSKRLYTFKDCVRRAAAMGAQLKPPASHPFNPLLSLRVTTLPMEEAVRVELIGRLYAATWAESRNVSSAEVVGAICDEVVVPNAIERAKDPAVKQQLKDASAAAVAQGVFGVPTMIVGDELFWGDDSFDHIARYLKGDDPAREIDAWRHVPASASRI